MYARDAYFRGANVQSSDIVPGLINDAEIISKILKDNIQYKALNLLNMQKYYQEKFGESAKN